MHKISSGNFPRHRREISKAAQKSFRVVATIALLTFITVLLIGMFHPENAKLLPVSIRKALINSANEMKHEAPGTQQL
ncbi:MAG: hypothetical protein ABTQ25_12860, partial [Nitrosomonas ureae]